MEKLIELLNEYEKDGVNEFETYVERWYCERTYQILSGKWENSNELKPCEIISKRYGFIKWLVENDKIDTQNLITYMNGTSLTFNKVPSTDCASIDKTWNNFYTECLLMLLSISDTPIEDLISYLN